MIGKHIRNNTQKIIFHFFLIFQFVHDLESGVKFQDLVTKNDTFWSEKMKSIVLRAQEELWEAPQHSTD